MALLATLMLCFDSVCWTEVSEKPAVEISGTRPQQSVHHAPGCGCCGLKPPPKEAEDELKGYTAWGLPTGACPASEYMMTKYPEQYRRQRRAGNVLVFCTRNGGWGNFVQTLPVAVLLSLLTGLALVVECDVEVRDFMDTAKSVDIHSRLSRYFVGPHFDWSGLVKLGSNVSELNLTLRPSYKVRENRTWAPMRLVTRGGARKMQVESFVRANERLAVRLLGKKLAHHSNLGGCLMRYVLAPSKELSCPAW